MKQLKAEVLRDAFEHFRRCGGGERECVVYFTSAADSPNLIDGVTHPPHTASPGGYDLTSEAIAELWKTLLEESRSIQMQGHTHPGPAFHSSRDDALALVNATGALSLVIPKFALGPIGLQDAFLARLNEEGVWSQASLAEEIVVVP